VGGGFAGTAAAVELAWRGARVMLVEARRRPGGRAASFADPESGETIDNGQHVLLGCCTATRELLRLLGTERLVRFQRRLALTLVEEGGRVTRLACPPLPAPAHLLAGLLALKGLTWADRAAVLRAAPRLMRLPGDGLTVEAWLDALGQTENLRLRFWRPVATAALNEDTRVAGAALWTGVLREAFGGGAAASGLGVPAAGLSDLYVGPAIRFLEERGGRVLTGCPAERVATARGRAVAVALRDGTELPCDAAVLAVPHAAAVRLLPAEAVAEEPALARIGELGASAVVSVNLWFDRPVTGLDVFGLVGGTVQFVFNKRAQWDPALARGTYLACVLSAASERAREENDAVAAAAEEDVRRYLPGALGARLVRTMVLRERQATFSGRPEVLALRPGPRTAVPNLALAGDWTATGLPGTIEGAVRSGLAAARTVWEALPGL
jgi:squalene-associated FAD-dependent desaturase